MLNTTFLLGPGRRTTLGTLTFQQFKPVDLQVLIVSGSSFTAP